MTIRCNYSYDEISSSPTVILSGSTDVSRGIIEVINSENAVFPPQCFEINNHNFKAIVHLAPNDNLLQLNVYNGIINQFGFPEFDPKVLDSQKLNLKYFPLSNNKPIHLCLILGKDSNGSFDMPRYRTLRGETPTLDLAIRKLKVAGRLMQAYTQDEMKLTGFSNRTFQFQEETISNQSLFGYNTNSRTPHQEVKVHVLRSPKTVAELRDPNLAQQNPKGTDTGGLFSHAIDVIKNSEIYQTRQKTDTNVQCAVIYLDATYDPQKDLILTHAALGGGTADIKLAIFGSHGLHSWPTNFPMITPSFLDQTRLSKSEVANDANQCGTSWECFNITLGAFMHEIGHSLGSPHQVDGVMLRDYIWWNRSFMTRELECLRSKTPGETIGKNGQWPRVCHWNILDKFRYLHHGSFALPIDSQDPTMRHTFTTTLEPDKKYNIVAPTGYNIAKDEVLVKSEAGIFLVEIITKDLARYHIPFLPKMYGGPGFQTQYVLNYTKLSDQLKEHLKDWNDNYDVRVLSFGGDLFIKHFKDYVHKSGNSIESDFGLGRGKITGFKSNLLGSKKDKPEEHIGIDISKVTKIRIYHGGALDGITFFMLSSDLGAPKVPPRNYMHKLQQKLEKVSLNPESVTIGHQKPHYTDVDVKPGEKIVKLNFRNGAWVDGVQFEFSDGRVTDMFGNKNGGHLSTLQPPEGFTLVGLYGYTGSWLDGIGIIYANI